jgi:hypothetical protein
MSRESDSCGEKESSKALIVARAAFADCTQAESLKARWVVP